MEAPFAAGRRALRALSDPHPAPMIDPMHPDESAAAVLVSGGLDSAILVAERVAAGTRVYPLYVRGGFSWEPAERDHLSRFLEAIATARLAPLVVLEMPVADLLEGHWGLTGRGVPDANSPDEAVYLPGRNVLLLAKGMLWCHLHGVASLALATLRGNPFPDATAEFFDQYEAVVNRAVRGAVRLVRPFAAMAKPEVMRIGRALPLELTFSCIRPVGGAHCGRCNKCAERRRAFHDAGLRDHTEYAAPPGSNVASCTMEPP
jgi:7-cyano-7-deazaguanine synthase